MERTRHDALRETYAEDVVTWPPTGWPEAGRNDDDVELDDGRGGFRTCDLSRVKRDDLRRKRAASPTPRPDTAHVAADLFDQSVRIPLDRGGYGHWKCTSAQGDDLDEIFNQDRANLIFA
jgi:hypothetical protein